MQNEIVAARQALADVPLMSAEAFAIGRRRLWESFSDDQARRRWARARRVAWVLWWVALACLSLAQLSRSLMDLEVYRNGGLAWLHGIPLYIDFPGPLPGPRLPFTYPPAAAVLFSTFATLPAWLTTALLTMAGFLALTAVCLVVTRRLCRHRDVAHALGLTAAITAIGLEPVLSTFNLGQINLLLMALVVIDCLAVRDRRLRGLLVGVAAAIKLTPAVFVLYFLVRRDWRSAANSAVAFAILAVLGFAFAPTDSVEYWFHALTDPSRIGGLAYGPNQSFRGLLHRLNPNPEAISLLWLGLSTLAMLLAVLIAHGTRHNLLALLAIAAGGLLASPVSWSHHWVWCVPAFLLLAARARTWSHRSLLAGVLLLYCTSPFTLLPHSDNRELHWTFWQHIPGNVYVWLAFAALVVLAVGQEMDRSRRR
ncbi:glycosyltransferase 87 family protein [Crossiella sp. NPDC003009]